MPLIFGGLFVSFSFELDVVFEGVGRLNTIKIVYKNGSIIGVHLIGLTVNVTNSHVVPVQIRYNGFDTVMLIYNRTVTNPADVVGNKDFLIWGAFETAYHIFGWTMYGFDYSAVLGNRTGYEYYLARKDLSNYTRTIPVGTTYYDHIFYELPFFPVSFWCGQDLLHRPVSPGNYHIYCIVYGKVSASPINLTVTSVLWPR